MASYHFFISYNMIWFSSFTASNLLLTFLKGNYVEICDYGFKKMKIWIYSKKLFLSKCGHDRIWKTCFAFWKLYFQNAKLSEFISINYPCLSSLTFNVLLTRRLLSISSHSINSSLNIIHSPILETYTITLNQFSLLPKIVIIFRGTWKFYSPLHLVSNKHYLKQQYEITSNEIPFFSFRIIFVEIFFFVK